MRRRTAEGWRVGGDGRVARQKGELRCSTVELARRKAMLCDGTRRGMRASESRGADKGAGIARLEERRARMGAGGKKILPPTSLKPCPRTYARRAAAGNFSMAPAELEFSLIFTFSRRPPRGSAIVRAASPRAPTTITEKTQRSESRG